MLPEQDTLSPEATRAEIERLRQENERLTKALAAQEAREEQLFARIDGYEEQMEHQLQGRAILTRGGIAFVNRRGAEITGHTVEELLALPSDAFLSLVHPDDRDNVRAHWEACLLEDHPPHRYEFRIMRPAPHRNGDGPRSETRWLEVFAGCTTARGQRAIELVFLDITDHKRAAQGLAESEARYRRLFASTRNPIFVIDEQGRYLDVNPAAADFLGRPADVIRGMSVYDFAPAEMSSADWEPHHALWETGGTVETVYLVDGKHKTLELTITPTYRGGEKVIYGIGRDVTEARHAETILRENAERFRHLAEHARDIVYRMHMHPKPHFEYISPAVTHITGYTPEELYRGAESVLGLVHPEEHQRLCRLFANATADDLAVQIRWVTKEGDVIWTDQRLVLIYDSTGTLRAIEGIARDITDQRITEEALAASEAKYRALFDNAGDAIFIHDREGRFREVNKTACQRLGYSREELLQMPLTEIHAPEVRDRIKPNVRKVLRRHDAVIETVQLTRDGQRIPTEALLRVIDYEGERAVLGIGRDISERKRLERQLRQAQKLEAVGRLAGGVAHDFNNLLTVINLESEFTMAEMPEGHPVRASLEEILNAGRRAADLTRQLLAFSRQQALSVQRLDLNDIINKLASMLRRLMGEDIRLTLDLASEPALIEADRTQMEQILLNMAANARDAMPQGGEFAIKTENVTLDEPLRFGREIVEAGHYVRLRMRDTGVGMSEEVRSHLFEPFYTTKAVGQGTGLGLAMVYGIVKQLQGQIAVDSAPNQGTTFTLCLPRAGDEARPDKPERRSAFPEGDETILLVEDERQVRHLAARILERQGYHVIEAEGASAALRLARDEGVSFDLLLTDVVMPEMSGRELAEALAEGGAEFCLLYMSGYTNDVVGHHGVLDPGTQLVHKPFTQRSLTTRVRKALDAR